MGAHRNCGMITTDKYKYYHRQQHQSQLKQQFDHNDQIKSPQPAERRDQSRLQQQIGQQHQFGERQSVGRSRQDQGQAGCYNCGETGHFKHNCPKPKVQGRVHKIELHLLDDMWTMMGDIEGKRVECEWDNGAAITVIPERLVPQPIKKTQSLQLTGFAGGSINANTTEVRVNIGPFNGCIEAAVVPDDIVELPLIGRNIGPKDPGQLLNNYTLLSGKRNRVNVNTVQTHKQQKEQEDNETAEQQALQDEQPHLIPLDGSVGEDINNEDECEMKSEGRIMNVLNRNEDELEVLCNLGGVNLSEEGERITEEYKRVMIQDESLKEWKKLAETKDKSLRLVDGILKKQYKDYIHGLKELLVIPREMRARPVSMAHDYCGHVGTDKVTWTLRQNFTWPGMYKQIEIYSQRCDSCQKARRENERKILMGEMPFYSKPFENVAVDLVGPLPRTREVLLDILRRASRG